MRVRGQSPCLHDNAPGLVEAPVQRARAKVEHSVMIDGDWVYREE